MTEQSKRFSSKGRRRIHKLFTGLTLIKWNVGETFVRIHIVSHNDTNVDVIEISLNIQLLQIW